ncbi:MAG: hypothetical protein ACRDEA_22655 [Microcystaceae cyanobacterium]
MIPSLEPLFCPCCTPALLHALSQYGFQTLSGPLNLLGTGALAAAVGLDQKPQSPAMSPDLDSFHCQGNSLP